MTQTAHRRYDDLGSLRTPFLDRGRDAAKLTIPSLLPPDGHNPTSRLPTPYQGIGARGLNNLASKLLLALLPPNSPFFRFVINDFDLEALTQQEGMRAEVEEGLNRVERSVMSEIETGAIRVSAFEALKQLIVSGNSLIYLPPQGGMKVFRLDRYVVVRDPMGNVLEIIVKESMAPELLPEGVQIETPGTDPSAQKAIDIYTWVRRGPKNWTVHQEVQGKIVPNSKGTYPLDASPWIPLRFTKIDGEDYGRGYVEEYYGDLVSLEALTKAIVEGSAAAAKILFLVNPNGTTSIRDIASAESGAIKSGNAADVTVLQTEKFADFRIAYETIQQIQQRLSFAFLLNSSVQRAGERVTAEEIRYMAGELEDALGGVYSILSQEFQLPLINRLMLQMQRQRRLPKLPKGVVRPAITTGLEALGRGHDMNKLSMFAQIAVQAAQLPPEVNKDDFLKRAGTSLGIDMKGMIKTPEEMQALMQQMQMQQMVEKLGPKAMDVAKEQMSQGNSNGPQG
jgi:hypothetical protein